MAETFLLKHILSPRLIEVMGRNIKSVYLEFDALGFSEASVSQLDGLALKQRAIMIAEKLHEYLPNHYPAAIEILMQTMDVELVDEDNLGRYNEFYFLPFAEFIAAYGLNHLPESVLAMNKLTKVFTSEFCIRPFIQRYPAEMMRILSEWVCDDNKHVRRLVSEGTRTRLPWAGRLPEFQANPQPVLDLLEKLKQDPELYVRRSVANNLNDIAKDNPDIVIQTLIRWNKIDDEGTQYIDRHASRTLIKAGHPEALVLLGFDPKSPIELLDFKVDGLVQFGGKLKFEFKIQKIETRLHFHKPQYLQLPFPRLSKPV